jgi:phage shock protein PspC (stress-responsive transcriptional regulator)
VPAERFLWWALGACGTIRDVAIETEQRGKHRRGRRLRLALPRRGDERMVAGVASALAARLGVQSTVVRLAFVLLALAGGAVYLVRRNQRKAELDEGIWHEAPAPASTAPTA